MQKTILFMDNEENFLDVHARLLEQAGYRVFRAATLTEAEEILDQKYIHLAILDIRMEDELDEQDIAGLTLAQKESYRPMPKIILTAYPNYEYAREALGPALNGLPPAVNFIGKAEGPKVMIQAVERVFAQHVHINWNLIIRWSKQYSFFLLTNLIEPRMDGALIQDRADELEDLFRRLFYKSSQITIGRLYIQREGQVILEVFAYGEGGDEQFIISCGRRQCIKKENICYNRFVPKDIGDGGITRLKIEETVHFAATTYALTGGDLERSTTLAEFYRDNSIKMVTTALNYLYGTTLMPWYKKGRFQEEKKTMHEFFWEWLGLNDAVFSGAQLEPRLDAICREALTAGLLQLDYSPHKLILRLPDGLSVFYPNPISCLSETRIGFTLQLFCGTTHGRLNGNSVLTDYQGRTWLIDFSQAGQRPLVCDFISLEIAIKFELLTTPNVQARYEMERRLLAISRLDEGIDTAGMEPELQKALQAISRVRVQASTVIGDDMTSYLTGLLFCTASQLTKYDPEMRHTNHELIPYLHSLLSAAMLCQKLAPLPRKELPSQALHSLWIDEPNKEVWVEGRQVSLSPQEFDLLLYLYDHQGQLCGRMTIAEQVFGVAYESGISEIDKRRMEEGRLNSTMSRLRKKIEANPDNPKYIVAVRREGYRLELDSPPTE
jgi:DNA-binding response OmpR family regulator